MAIGLMRAAAARYWPVLALTLLGAVLRFLASELGLRQPRVGDAGPARGGNKRCRNNLLRSTGVSFTFPTFREGYRDVIAGNGSRHP